MSYNFSEAAMREGRGFSSSLRKMSFNVILLRKNNCDRKSLCNFFAKNCSYKSFDVKTKDDLILLVSSKSATLKLSTELLAAQQVLNLL